MISRVSKLECRIIEGGKGARPRSGGSGNTAEERLVVKPPGSILEDEPRSDERVDFSQV